FARPGLRKNENIIFLFSMIFGLLCFGLGVYFAYRIMLPFMLYFLSSVGGGSGISAAVSVQSYMTFLMTVFVVFGIVFELPVISILLTQMGLLRVQWMRKGRRVVIVAIFVAAALITPPDVVSQVMVAIPMMALYELSILLCTLVQKLRDRAEKKKENL
ncbi:MAG: twin-arginine translocase subunit TatC, partial [Oscillospiraceae bacterium]|nr:twin-arginine translocase subunit TatC [Oscillospiraceae bacterium]